MKKNIKQYIVLALFLTLSFVCAKSSAQELEEFDMSDTTLTLCQGILYDSGGENGLYENNSNITTVINTGGIISLTFFGQFVVEPGLDFLTIYDGVGTGGPVLATLNGTSVPPQVVATSGAVTLVFTSDNSAVYAGFSLEWETEVPLPDEPQLTVNPTPTCGSFLLQVNFDYTLACAWVDAASFTFFRDGAEINVLNVMNACTGDSTDYVILNLEEAIDVNCTYLVHLDILIPDACGVFWPFQPEVEFTYDGCGINGEIISSVETLCPGGCTNLTFQTNGCLTYTFAWDNGLGSGAGPHSVCPLVTTTYSVLVTEVETGNTAVFDYTVDVSGAQILTQDTTVCQSVDAFILNAGTTGIWTGPGIQDEETGLFEPDSAFAGINVIYFEALGCLDSVEVFVEPISTDNTVAACPGTAPFQLNSEPSGGFWNGPFTTNGGVFDPSTVGSYVSYYTVNGCQDSVVVNVDDITGTFTFDTICQSVWYDTLAFSPLGGYWSGQGILDSLLGVFVPASVTPGDAEFVYHINGCEQTFTGFVKEIYTGDAYHSACPLEDPQVFYTTDPTPAGGFWTGDGVIDTNTGLFDPGLFPTYAYTSMIYYAPNGCSDTTFVEVVLTEVLTTSFDFCENDDPFALNEENVDHYPFWGGQWTGNGLTNPAYDEWYFNPSIAGPGEHMLYYEKNTCIDSLLMIVYPSQINVADQEFCSTDDPFVFGAGVTPGGVWSGSAGFYNTATGGFDPNVAETGNYYVYWTAPPGCVDSVNVFVEDLEQATISNLLSEYCFVDSAYVFETTPGGGVLNAPVTTNSFNPAEFGVGEYTFIYSVEGVVCASADTIVVSVSPELITAVSVTDTVICIGGSSTISIQAQGGANEGAYTYSWSDGGFPVSQHTYAPTSSSWIVCTTSDGCSDPAVDSVYIEVLPPIDFEVTISDTLCFGENGFATVTYPSGGNFETSWNGVLGETTIAEAGSALSLHIVDLDSGCETDTSVFLPSYPPIIASFSLSPNEECISYADRGDVDIIDTSSNGVSGTWTVGADESAYTPGVTPNLNFSGAGFTQITLVVLNIGGCGDTAQTTVCILPPNPIFIPDIFSPNGDGNNDEFFIRGYGIINLNVRIYNRYGEKVFEITNPEQGWDGRSQGKPAPSGNYVFYAEIELSDGSVQQVTDELTLIR
ncbi:MAG: gliding motility-associated C-terminal domain-containing protein [Flavobacteriales bacterium]